MRRYEQVKITEISIKNFRSIVNMNIDVEQLNMFVGLNDVGKSNVLKALNLFLIMKQIIMKSLLLKVIFRNYFPKRVRRLKK